jgi:hypothetical protein
MRLFAGMAATRGCAMLALVWRLVNEEAAHPAPAATTAMRTIEENLSSFVIGLNPPFAAERFNHCAKTNIPENAPKSLCFRGYQE